MEYSLFLNFIISLVIFAICFFYICKNRKNENYNKVIFYLISFGLISLILLPIFFLWILKIAEYSYTDFIVLFSFLIVLKTILIYGLFYSFEKNKKIFILFFLFFSLIVSPLVRVQLSFLILSTSFLLMLFLFIQFYSNPYLNELGGIGILYSSLSLIFHFILFIQPIRIGYFFFFSEILFLFFLVKLFKKMQKEKYLFRKKSPKKQLPYLIHFFRYFVLIIALVSVIFVATVSIHELGHIGFSRLFGCDYQRIVYEHGAAYTEILCGDLERNSIVILGGLLVPLFISLLLFVGGGRFMKEIATMILGFDLILSFKDFVDFGISNNLAIFISIIGGLLIIISIGFFSKSRIEDI